MITQECRGLKLNPEKGFFITGNSYENVFKQLDDYCKQNPKKWIYFSDCGVRPGKPVPVAEWCLEVEHFDKKPAALMIFWKLRQRGCEALEEEVTSEMMSKHMKFYYMLGSSINRFE